MNLVPKGDRPFISLVRKPRKVCVATENTPSTATAHFVYRVFIGEMRSGNTSVSQVGHIKTTVLPIEDPGRSLLRTLDILHL